MSILTPPSSLSPRAALRGKTFLVAGATGFLGKVWLAQLLQHVPESRVVLLVRRRGTVGARERVAERLQRSPAFRELRDALGHDFAAQMRARVRVVEADLRQPLALPEALLAEVDCCVNLAGTIDFVADPSEALAVNVGGALALAELAEATEGRRLVHVSTCYVSGPGAGPRPEEPLTTTPRGLSLDVGVELAHLRELVQVIESPAERARLARARAEQLGWPNVYTLTKALAEAALSRRTDLDLCIVRPAIVENALDYPFPGWNEGLKTTAPMTYLMHSGLARVPAMPEHKIDVIPVDDVGRGLLLACAALVGGGGPSLDIWQLASSAVRPIQNARFVELTTLGALRHGAPAGREGLLRALQPKLLGRRDRSWLAPARLRAGVRSLRSALGPGGLDRRLEAVEVGLARAAKATALLEPFILDHDHAYAMDRAQAASDGLPPADRAAFGLRTPTLDWRRYVVDVLYPGQRRWCFPLVEGRQPEPDPRDELAPGVPALELGETSLASSSLSEAS